MPRTWPSIRLSRAPHSPLVCCLHGLALYPTGVYTTFRADEPEWKQARARPPAVQAHGSGLRHAGRSRGARPTVTRIGARPTISAAAAAGASSRPIRSATSAARRRRPAPPGADLHLPDAPGDPAGRPRHLPDLRHGARAAGRHRRGRAEPRARRHDPALLDRRWRSPLPVFLLEMGGAPRSACITSCRRRRRPGSSSLLATPVVLWAGWPFFERGWASLQSRNLNMFTPDRARHRRRLGSTAWSRRCAPGPVPGRLPRRRRHGRGLLRGRRRHHRAGAARARCWSCGRASRPAAPSARC